jgi:transcriptional regulator with XRE-family HTH domain
MSDFTSTSLTLREWEQQIGGALRQLRLEAGLGQVELADRANISRSSVQSLEQGAGSRLVTIIAVLRALDRLDVFDAIMPEEGPTPMQLLAEAKRSAKPQRNRKTKD